MTTADYNYIIYTAIGLGLALISYVAFAEIQNWLMQRKQYAEAHRLASQNYTQGLLDRIAQLEQALRDAAMAQLSLVEERRRLIARCTILAQELGTDEIDKKTRVLSR
jgi:hypothetical protein